MGQLNSDRSEGAAAWVWNYFQLSIRSGLVGRLEPEAGTADIAIHNGKTLTGFCEVKRDFEEKFESCQEALLNYDALSLPLLDIKDSWGVTITNRFLVKNLPTVQPEIQNFIKSLVEGGREMWTFRDFDLDGAMEENFKKLHKAGILNVFRSPCPGPPKAHLIIEPVSFVSSPGALPEFQAWIDTLFEKHKHKSSLQSMERISDLSHREIFVWRGSATPAEISFHIMHHPDVVPNVEINVPEWVTKLWIEGPTRGTEQTFWIFEPQIGWKTFDVPSAQLIKVLERVAPTPTPGICPGTA